MTELNADQIREAFFSLHLEENYNFLADDLAKLANAFVAKAEPLIRADELAQCVEVVIALNRVVGEKLQEVRG